MVRLMLLSYNRNISFNIRKQNWNYFGSLEFWEKVDKSFRKKLYFQQICFLLAPAWVLFSDVWSKKLKCICFGIKKT